MIKGPGLIGKKQCTTVLYARPPGTKTHDHREQMICREAELSTTSACYISKLVEKLFTLIRAYKSQKCQN